MKITTNQKFRHDKTTYEADSEYDVSDELGHYFVNVGWAGPYKPSTDTETDLEVADVTNDQSPKDV